MPKTPDPVAAFDELKLQQIFRTIENSNILNDVAFDKEQGELISERIRIEIERLCSN